VKLNCPVFDQLQFAKEKNSKKAESGVMDDI